MEIFSFRHLVGNEGFTFTDDGDAISLGASSSAKLLEFLQISIFTCSLVNVTRFRLLFVLYHLLFILLSQLVPCKRHIGAYSQTLMFHGAQEFGN